MCSKKMKVSQEMINKMIQENDHNKYTTLYYLLLKKLEKGDLNIEEIENEQRMEENLEKRKSVNMHMREEEPKQRKKSRSRKNSQNSRGKKSNSSVKKSQKSSK
jgi:PBP1b-binding outer membrane lipoprotein LpoB